MRIVFERTKLRIILIKKLDDKKVKKKNNLLPTLKKHSQCKGCGIDLKKYYVHLKISNAHKCFTTCKLGVYMYMICKIKL